MSPLDPHSPASHDIATLWWWMLAVAGIIFAGAVGLLTIGWLRRGRRGLPLLGESERANTGLVVVFGMVIPISILVALFIVADLVLIKHTDAPARGTTAMTVTVVGHQWFWEVRYPGTAAVTANEIHIPARTPVEVAVKSADVIHSFWVPQLNRKIDMIPGQTNRIELYADETGAYRGQCAEFCGLQHAHMAFEVYAQPPRAFRGWLAKAAAPARPPRTAEERSGEQVFMDNACASCHTIRGTAADGTIGPDLTHLASRNTIAALTLDNTPRNLIRWVHDPQSVKPGNKMPGVLLSDPQLRSVVSYLEGLR